MILGDRMNDGVKMENDLTLIFYYVNLQFSPDHSPFLPTFLHKINEYTIIPLQHRYKDPYVDFAGKMYNGKDEKKLANIRFSDIYSHGKVSLQYITGQSQIIYLDEQMNFLSDIS